MAESNLSMFFSTLSSQMQSVQKAGDTISVDLGRINPDWSLAVDRLQDTIPKGEYLLALHLTGKTGEELQTLSAAHTHSGGEHAQYSGSGAHSHSDGDHFHVLPEPLRGLKPGDRVLVAWVGFQAVVLDLVVSSN